jgi:hypothetical protein
VGILEEIMALVEVKHRVRDLAADLQLVMSHVEQGDKVKALLAISEAMSELSKITTIIATGFLQDSPADSVEPGVGRRKEDSIITKIAKRLNK